MKVVESNSLEGGALESYKLRDILLQEAEEEFGGINMEVGELSHKTSGTDATVSAKESLIENSIPDMDYTKLNIAVAKTKSKKHFCLYCKTLQTKLARHFENKHKAEEIVKLFLSLQPKDKLRLKVIGDLRSKGNFIYNTNKQYNTDNNLIVVRRPAPNKKRNASHYKPCGNCGGMYSSISLASHYRKCQKQRMKGSRDVILNSRKQAMFMTAEASPLLRREILPTLRQDEVTKTILSDALIITFGNRLCQKYRSPHLYKMIRAKLRCIARFFLTLKKRRPYIQKLEECFDPSFYDSVIESINDMCQLNEETGKYKSPATAFSVGSYLKKISFYLLSEYIKMKAKERQDGVKDFLHLLEEGLPHDIYKTVTENQLEQKRQKKIELPNSDDISVLRNYLDRRREIHMKKLEQKFTFDTWKKLLSVILISLQLFNRRRAGEIERVEIDDFLKYEQLREDDEMLTNIPLDEKLRMKNYVRFLIRGKLSRGVPVMINKSNLRAIKLCLKLRHKACVPKSNPFLFGLPGLTNYKHLFATELMNKYSQLCGAKKPHTLRGTELRKHIATKCGVMDLGQTELKDVADYLGHHEKIHLDHYRLPNATKDIVRVSNILESAMGGNRVVSENSVLTEDSVLHSKNNNSNNILGNLQLEDNDPHEKIETSSINSFVTSSKKRLRRLSSTDEESPSSRKEQRLSLSDEGSPSGRKTQRLSWSQEEKTAVENEFESYLENFELPSLSECYDVVEKVRVLNRRSAEQLKAYINNQITKKKKQMSSNVGKIKKVERRPWSTPERHEVFRIFKNELKERKLPSLQHCKDVIGNNTVFKDRTEEMLKAFINNTIRKQKRIELHTK